MEVNISFGSQLAGNQGIQVMTLPLPDRPRVSKCLNGVGLCVCLSRNSTCLFGSSCQSWLVFLIASGMATLSLTDVSITLVVAVVAVGCCSFSCCYAPAEACSLRVFCFAFGASIR